MKLSEIKVGETFKIKDEEFIVLSHCNKTTNCLRKDLLPSRKFDNNTSNFAKSDIYKFLNEEYYKQLSEKVGAENIIEHEVDLIMDTGHKDYGTCQAKISLLTADMFRKYVDILDKYNPGDWWWLATADSRQFPSFVRFVSFSGSLYDDSCNYDDGVRPFIIFSSEIVVSD